MSTAVFIESNMTGYGPEGMRLTREHGFAVHFVTRDAAEYTKLNPNPIVFANTVSEVDTYDLVKLMYFFSHARADAILAFDDYRLIQAAIIGQRLGLPHADPDGLLNCHFKDRTRTLADGIGHHIEAVRVSLGEAGDRAPLPYPCVVKPVDDSGSTDVRICKNDEDYRQAIATMLEHPVNLRGYRRAAFALVEEFVEGPEFTAEMIWDESIGEWRLLGFTKKLMAEPPFRVELGAMFPYSFGDTPTDAAVAGIVRRWLAAVGHRFGAAHVEFKMVNGIPALIEINPRLGGDQIRELIRMTIGEDPIDLYTRLYLGLPPSSPDQSARGGYATSFYLTPKRNGLVTSVTPPTTTPPAIMRSQFIEHEFQVNGVRDNDDRLGYVLSWAKTFDGSYTAASDYLDAVDVRYAP